VAAPAWPGWPNTSRTSVGGDRGSRCNFRCRRWSGLLEQTPIGSSQLYQSYMRGPGGVIVVAGEPAFRNVAGLQLVLGRRVVSHDTPTRRVVGLLVGLWRWSTSPAGGLIAKYRVCRRCLANGYRSIGAASVSRRSVAGQIGLGGSGGWPDLLDARGLVTRPIFCGVVAVIEAIFHRSFAIDPGSFAVRFTI
jgi:hypothetical protein